MTEANRQNAVREELERAEVARSASMHLAAGGFVADAVSRLYYSLLYLVRGVLLTRGLEAKSHEGALRLLSLHFVKAGLLETSVSHLFARLMKYREEADYNASYVFSREDYQTLKTEVEGAAARLRRIIQAEGMDPGHH